ncbi:hypothetical protein EW145_g3709 [Phellinidium pouzarii]|uniref:RRM domain-containing protein n=1 Tax=Phellinidium pouzarii TaxID=167371 RepID=A0A4S4L6M8_9AGAM|nr:hypothetical protein EW145_g3709 [Phellinidium pouzarii]
MRPSKPGQSKADEDNVWKHDLYKGPGKSLNSRLSDVPMSGPRVNSSGAALALRQAIGLGVSRSSSSADLNIKGASAMGSNVVQIENLAAGTSAADVEAIFKRCGHIIESYVFGPKDASKVTVRLKFKNTEDAKRAVIDYDGKSADGNTLTVSVIGSASTSLGGRLAGGVVNGTVDVLMDEDPDASGGSKMRSDELLSDPRAQVLVVPPGVDPAEYEQQGGRGRGRASRGRGGRRGRGRRGGTASAMVVD